MIRTRVALLLAGSSSVTACKREAKLVRQVLPGFSIEPPEGRPVATLTALGYATGSYTVRDDDHHQLAMLGWSVGAKLSPTELGQLISILGALTHTTNAATVIREPGPLETTVETTVFPTDRMPIAWKMLRHDDGQLMLTDGSESPA